MPMAATAAISVVVPCYNAAAWIVGTLRSIYAQDWPNLEVLVVDDGSQDDSVARIKQAFPQTTVLQQANAGVAAARNAGIQAAAGQWVAFIDADDHWLPGKLRAQMDLLSAWPEARMAYTSWQTWHSDLPDPPRQLLDTLRQQDSDAARWDGPSGWIYPELLLGCRVWTSTVVMHRSLLDELGGFNPTLKIGEDYDLWLRASRVTPIVRVKRPLALYRLHPSSLTKRAPAQNHEASVVEHAIHQWGYASPEGRSVHKATVRRSLARTWHAFGEANLAAGRVQVGLLAARRALRDDWRHLGAWKLTLKALVRSVWRPL